MSARTDDEEVLDPGPPIIDTHGHLWKLPDAFFEVAGASSIAAYRTYLLDECLADLASGHDVRATVYMEADPMRPMYRTSGPESLRAVGEVEFANGIAAMAASASFDGPRVAAAIVGHVKLEQDVRLVAAALDAQQRAGGDRYRGVREPTISSRIPHLYADESFRRGFRLLAERGLSFDALLTPGEMPDLVALAESAPGTTIVLDHLGSPDPARFGQWRDGIRDAARRCPDLTVKLGGLGMARLTPTGAVGPFGSVSLADAWRPYLETCIEAFGVDRCMFEGNFPMDSETCSYRVLWNTFKRVVAGASAEEKNALFHGTAERVYRIAI